MEAPEYGRAVPISPAIFFIMSNLSQARIDRINARITALQAILDNYDATLTESSLTNVKEYDWQDGGGRQAVKRKNDKDIFQNMERIQSEIERLYRILDMTGNPRINPKAY